MECLAEGDSVVLTKDTTTTCRIRLFGATVTSWICDGKEFLFLSSKSKFDNKTAIRGGIPIVFPNFGPWALGPQHGFARTSRWTVDQQPVMDEHGSVTAVLTLDDNETTRSLWNHKFKLVYTVTLGEKCLETSLNIKNTGENEFDFTCLLHTYFRVPDVSKATVTNLTGLTLVDKVEGGARSVEDREKVSIDQTVDRVYENSPDTHQITGVTGGHTIELRKANLPDTVVWNPWTKGLGMADLGEEYVNMLCVEAGHVSSRVHLEPSKDFVVSQTISIVE